jgi:glycosyltransferase involved in cell wall biosynthesis
MSRHIWFWADEVSPHLVSLYSALIARGVDIHVIVAAADPGAARMELGWPSSFDNIPSTIVAPNGEVDALLARAPADAVHICSRLDFRSVPGRARRLLAQAKRDHWAITEAVNDFGVFGPFKKLKYSRLIPSLRGTLAGILAIGGRTRPWLIDRGADASTVYPFAYFIEAPEDFTVQQTGPAERPLRLCYLGNFTSGKRVDLLIRAAAAFAGRVEIEIIGRGDQEGSLRKLAASFPQLKVAFYSAIPMADVFARLARADYLVQPSQADGWGVVISEALMVGTHVICSDACGASVAVEASGAGAVFRRNDLADLRRCVGRALAAGPVSSARRRQVADWAECLSGPAGADYLLQILDGRADERSPPPPWTATSPRVAAEEFKVQRVVGSQGQS